MRNHRRGGPQHPPGLQRALTHLAASQAGQPAWAAITQYNELGQEIERLLPGSVVNRWQYDTIGRPTHHRVQTRERDTRRRGYTWGVNAQIKSVIDELRTDTKLYGYVDPNHGITAYRYDEMNNLVSAETRRRRFTYRSADEVGNIYETADNSDRIYQAGSRLEQAGVNTNELKNIYQGGKGKLVTKGTAFAYDVEGNLSQKTEKNGDVWRYEYYGNGMLRKVVRPDGGEVTFRYDALGRRVEKKTSETTKRFLWDGNRPLHEWEEDKGKEITTWVFDDGFVPMAKLTNAGNYGVVTDHIGTPVEAFDAKGERIWSAELDIYGRVKEFTGEENFIPFRYQGQYADQETGLYYNRFRYYDPAMGQYTQQDPIGLAGGNPTLYGYVGNTLFMVDVFGLIIFPPEQLQPGTVTPTNMEGIYKINATGSRGADYTAFKNVSPVEPSGSWRVHHVDYDPSTNTMRMQSVDPTAHAPSHTGGVNDFQNETKLKYDTKKARDEATKRNNACKR